MSSFKQYSLQEIIQRADYDDAVNAGMQVRAQIDKGRFEIGDLADALDTRYGKGVIEEYAKDISLGKSTVYEYVSMATYYTPDWRQYIQDRYGDVDISYSILFHAKRLGDIEHALDLLEWCSENDKWTVDAVKREVQIRLGKPKRKKKLGQAIFRWQKSGGGYMSGLVMANEQQAIFEELTDGQYYQIDIYELDEQETPDDNPNQ